MAKQTINQNEDALSWRTKINENTTELYDQVKFIGSGNNVLRYDDVGKPSLMVRIPRMKRSDIYPSIVAGSDDDDWLSCFKRQDGSIREYIEISKYQNIVESDRAYSVQRVDPRVYVTLDQARTYCTNKGAGWVLMTQEMWELLAAWSYRNGTVPHGNNHCGCDVDYSHESGTQSYTWLYGSNWSGRAYKEEPAGTFHHAGRTLTGSGPATWSHNHKEDGVYDLNGNVWEWTDGFKIIDSIVYIAPYAGAPENEWVSTGVNICTGRSSGQPIATLMTGAIPNVAGKKWEELGVPATTGAANSNGDAYWFNPAGERFMLRGGYWNYGVSAGVRASGLNYARSFSSYFVGFRAAFIGE